MTATNDEEARSLDMSSNATDTKQEEAKEKVGAHGRTVWDIVAEIMESKPQRNWYRISFYILIILLLGYVWYRGDDELSQALDNIQKVATSAEAIQQSATATAASVSHLEKRLERPPSMSAGWFSIDMDQAACKGKAVEAFERLSAKDVKSSESSWVQGTLPSSEAIPPLAMVGCTNLKTGIIVVVAGRDSTASADMRDKLETFMLHKK